MKTKAKNKVVKKGVVIKKKTLEELDRQIKWLRTEWRNDYSSARTCVKKDRKQNKGRIYKVNKIPDSGFAVLIYGRKKEDYENLSRGREWSI